MALPSMLTVAPRGNTKSMVRFLSKFPCPQDMETGSAPAEEDVPKAIITAGRTCLMLVYKTETERHTEKEKRHRTRQRDRERQRERERERERETETETETETRLKYAGGDRFPTYLLRTANQAGCNSRWHNMSVGEVCVWSKYLSSAASKQTWQDSAESEQATRLTNGASLTSIGLPAHTHTHTECERGRTEG
jgi:hypothetical protein